MSPESTRSQLDMALSANDMSGVNALREAVNTGDEKALKAAAKQFEAIFVQMMLKSMRKAQEVLSDKNSPFNSQQVQFYRDMHDQQLASDLSKNGGLGLAEIIEQQLDPTKENFQPASILRNDGSNEYIRSRIRGPKTVVSAQVEANKPAFKGAAFENAQDFVAKLYPYAEKAAQKLGIEPRALIAQAAVETGWGQHVIHDGAGNSTNNLFGIKAKNGWQGEHAVVDTLEFEKGIARPQKAAFRAYESIEQSLNDYVDFIRSQHRYKDAVEQSQDSQQYFQSLQNAGYATDPKYAEKIMAVLNSSPIRSFMP